MHERCGERHERNAVDGPGNSAGGRGRGSDYPRRDGRAVAEDRRQEDLRGQLLVMVQDRSAGAELEYVRTCPPEKTHLDL